MLGVVVLPLAYSLFYLGAFWNPYGKLDELPVAVVNEDNGAVINGATRNLGNEFEDSLKKDNTLKWIFTDSTTAQKGLNGTDYYAVITIPQNFSTAVASSETGTKETAKITFAANEKRNFLASQILGKAVVEMQESLQSKVDSEITAQLVKRLGDVPSKLTDLSDGLTKLNNGAGTLSSALPI